MDFRLVRLAIADVAELVYAYVSEAYGAILEGSSPSVRTNLDY